MRRALRCVFGLALLAAVGWQSAAAQEQVLLRITRLDISEFPFVRVSLVTADSRGAPLTDFSEVSLRENGIPIGDLEFSSITVGTSVTFVIDANAAFLDVDNGSELTRHEKVRESIVRYARQFMSDGDAVSIVVPDDRGASGIFLVEDATDPTVVTAVLEQYTPESLSRTPLQEMMLLALAHASDGKDSGNYQAIMLFTDGGQLDRQLTYDVLVAQAQSIQIPVFAALLGARADPNEIESVSRLSEPTHGSYVHMPNPADTDPVYSIWRRQREQTQISYRSLQSKSGRYPVTINIGASRALAELVLVIAPPEITFALPESVIQRTGNAPDTPLTSLIPTIFPVRVLVHWEGGQSRPLVAANLFADGQLLPAPTSLQSDADGYLVFEWDVSGLDEGTYSLMAQVTDELGISAVSEPITVSVVIERPPPPTPTIAPTVTPAENDPVPPLQLVDDRLLIALTATGASAAFGLLLLRRRRLKLTQDAETEPEVASAEASEPRLEPVQSLPQLAFLEILSDEPGHVTRIRIEGESVTIGRDHNVAQITFDDPSVAQLHAQIKKRDGRYWLYDEGSADGTFLNYERLGLTPRPLSNQDKIHFGRIGLRFHLQQPAERAANDFTASQLPNS